MEEKAIITTPDELQEYFINMGPQHPSTHGVLRLLVSLKGEMVRNIQPHVGYIHSGIEKMCESLTYPQIIHLTDRMDYISAHINNEAVCLNVEKALEIDIPDRIKVIRTIMSELTRLQSHQLWWACFGMDLGGLTCFFYGLRDREKILDIFEETCGGRMIVSYNCPGGLMYDIHPNFQKRVKDFIKYFRKILPEYDARIEEMWESMKIIEQLIDNIPEGPYAVKMKPIIKLPEGEYYQRVETARGELGVFVISDGNKNPYRVKFRSPNFSNLSVLNHIASGFKIADLVAIGGSLDLIIPDIDR